MGATMLLPANAGCVAGLDYVPSRLEAERMASLSRCRMTRYKALVGGRVAVEEDAGPCPTCGGMHAVVDVFADAAQARAATAHRQPDAMATVRGPGEELAFVNLTGGRAVKALFGHDPAVRWAEAGGPTYKAVLTDDPRLLTRG